MIIGIWLETIKFLDEEIISFFYRQSIRISIEYLFLEKRGIFVAFLER